MIENPFDIRYSSDFWLIYENLKSKVKEIKAFEECITSTNLATNEMCINTNTKIIYIPTDITFHQVEGVTVSIRIYRDFGTGLRIVLAQSLTSGNSLAISLQRSIIGNQITITPAITNVNSNMVVRGFRITLE